MQAGNKVAQERQKCFSQVSLCGCSSVHENKSHFDTVPSVDNQNTKYIYQEVYFLSLFKCEIVPFCC